MKAAGTICKDSCLLHIAQLMLQNVFGQWCYSSALNLSLIYTAQLPAGMLYSIYRNVTLGHVVTIQVYMYSISVYNPCQ